MLPKLVELHFSQLQSEWSVSKYNKYSDLRKQDYHDNLKKIIEFLEQEDFSKLEEAELIQRYYVLKFVFKSLEFLNHSTTSSIPYEIVFVLELALNEWSSGNEYLIVTSLINGNNEFSFDNSLISMNFIYDIIKLLYDVEFSKKLVQINLPQSTSRDYLANVVLYHELGHFIDRQHKIAEVIHYEILKALKSKMKPKDKEDIYEYFPYLKNLKSYILDGDINEMSLRLHIIEYFCDLFASLYVKGCSNFYLDYITENPWKFSPTHPSTLNRIKFVNAYLSNKGGYVLGLYKKTIKKITEIDVVYKAKDFKSENFQKLIPVVIKNPKELHSLFSYGWSIWMSDWNKIQKKAGIAFKLSNTNVYEIVNNLIEKSIGNFIIKNEWENAKSELV